MNSLRPIPLHRIAASTKDWAAIGSYHRDPIDMRDWLTSRAVPDEPHIREGYWVVGGVVGALVVLAVCYGQQLVGVLS